MNLPYFDCGSCGGGVTVNVGAGNNATTTVNTGYTSGTQVQQRDEVSIDKNFPAGAYYVSIKPVKGFITVNGETVSEGGHFHLDMRIDEVTKTQDFIPAVNVVSNGNPYWYEISYPSSANVTEADITNA